jgi:hypothetical protein
MDRTSTFLEKNLAVGNRKNNTYWSDPRYGPGFDSGTGPFYILPSPHISSPFYFVFLPGEGYRAFEVFPVSREAYPNFLG